MSREKLNKLESLLSDLNVEVFRASDSLGWSYQFWQTENKKKINASEVKIGADELPAVTQLFTEDYMVDFLLDNTLGAWWAGRMLASNPELAKSARDEAELRKAVSLPDVPWAYLRFIKEDGWRPAAGAFEGWPKTSAELKCLDPCMGSGHFIVAMFERLIAMRMADEKIDEIAAIQAVIRDSLFGLEIDPRCTQIAAFNLALVAWRRVGYRPLPAMHLACSGLAPIAKKEDWLALAGKSERLRVGMGRLFDLFKQASVLGSLINPREIVGDLHSAEFAELRPLLDQALKRESADEEHELAVTARGIAEAAEILSKQYTLVTTNVPFLGYREMNAALVEFIARAFQKEKGDLGYCLWRRFRSFVSLGRTIALVTLQHWLSLRSYTKMRDSLFLDFNFGVIGHLGTRAFETITGDKVNITLSVTTRVAAPMESLVALVDVASLRNPRLKAKKLAETEIGISIQAEQYKNPDHRISFGKLSDFPCLSKYAHCLAGIMNGDSPKYVRKYWEIPKKSNSWAFLQTTPLLEGVIGGLENIILYDEKGGHLREDPGVRKIKLHNADERGNSIWGHPGIAIGQMDTLRVSRYFGNKYDSNIAVVCPKDPRDLDAIWTFCASEEFNKSVRAIDRKMNVTNATFGKVPINIKHWREVAAEKYPNGLPKPFSGNPTQWLFNGHPEGSGDPLHVAVARLLGYLWPRQTGSDFPDCPALGPDGLEKLADKDGIICIPSVRGEETAADRLRKLLNAAYGEDWKPGKENELIRSTGSEAGNLDEWLRNDFFKQHCDIFHQRPFVWHIWDGRKSDGFHALINYHKLAGTDGSGRKTLELLTHSYLNDWIARQREGVKRDLDGAEARLLTAQELKNRLEAILEGEPPFDIFIRWKPLSRQPIGWEPDINDGVRMNIRPFMASTGPGGRTGAGILRWKPNIKWDKDRGKEPLRPKEEYPWFWQANEFAGNRVNDKHLTVQEKQSARRN